MEEINKVNTALAIVLIAFAVVITAGLVVLPALQEVQAAVCGLASQGRDRSTFAREGEGGLVGQLTGDNAQALGGLGDLSSNQADQCRAN